MDAAKKRIEFLTEEAAKFCKAVGLKENLPVDIFREASDWAFIVKMDALLETACRETVSGALQLVVNGDVKPRERISEFVDGLNVNGRTSLRTLLKAADCPDELVSLIDAVRRVRNAYAHNIRRLDDTLLSVISAHPDRGFILLQFSQIDPKGYKEEVFLKMVAEDLGFLRFGVFDGTLRFLTLAYNVVLKDKGAKP